jgi:hypothetical protein
LRIFSRAVEYPHPDTICKCPKLMRIKCASPVRPKVSRTTSKLEESPAGFMQFRGGCCVHRPQKRELRENLVDCKKCTGSYVEEICRNCFAWPSRHFAYPKWFCRLRRRMQCTSSLVSKFHN